MQKPIKASIRLTKAKCQFKGVKIMYYEFWDKRKQEWCLGRMSLWRFAICKFYFWLYGETDEVADFKRAKVRFE